VEGSHSLSLVVGRETFDVFSQDSAQSATCHLGVRYQCNRDESFVGLGGQCYGFKGLSYLLRALSTFLENSGEKFQFFSKGILVVRKSNSSVWES
jgi:hypothetical protein